MGVAGGYDGQVVMSGQGESGEGLWGSVQEFQQACRHLTVLVRVGCFVFCGFEKNTHCVH